MKADRIMGSAQAQIIKRGLQAHPIRARRDEVCGLLA
jgi:hypothetical protein